MVYRVSTGIDLTIKIPSASFNFTWLRNDNRLKPSWSKQYKCRKTPSTWFNDVVGRILRKYGTVYVIQPYRVLEKCAPACWNASIRVSMLVTGENQGAIVEFVSTRWDSTWLRAAWIHSCTFSNFCGKMRVIRASPIPN